MSFSRGAYTRNGFPKPGDGPVDVASRHNREGWTRVAQHDSVQLGGKQYRHMEEWSRPCAICETKFSVYEKSGQVDANSRFSNRTCEAHRGLLPAFEKGFIAWDKDAGTMTAGYACSGAVANDDLATVTKERDEAWEMNVELMTELGKLKARLAKYELQPAMQSISEKMPWETQ